jgi:hypothetical protein
MDWVFGELPLHPLLVHATVILVPLAALCLVLSAVWPAARRRLGLLTPLLALAALIAVPITIAAGQWLAERVPATPLIARHHQFGDSLWPWSLAVFVLAAVVWAWHRFGAKASPRMRRTAGMALAVVAVAVAIGSVVVIVQIGESGAAAVWTGNFSDDPLP